MNQSRLTKIFTSLVVIFSWLLSIGFTIAGTLARNYGGQVQTIYVSYNNTGFGNHTSVENYMKRDEQGGELQPQYIFQFTLLGFCLVCLVTILICYASFFRIIRRIREYDEKLRGESARRPSKLSLQSCGTEEVRLDERKIKRQLIGRNKYVLVIGLVIAVYLLYLLSYGTIQIFQYFNLRSQGRSQVDERNALVIRSALQVLVGIHAALQPICYFRMKDFRLLAYATFQSATGRRANAFAASNNLNGTISEVQNYSVAYGSGGMRENRASGASMAQMVNKRKMSEAPVEV